jgi:hypothetical protein
LVGVNHRNGPWLLTEYVVIYGKARIEEGGAAEWLRRLSHTYIGPETDTRHLDDAPLGYVLRITPERLTGVGPRGEGIGAVPMNGLPVNVAWMSSGDGP